MLVALLVAACIVLGSPYVGQILSWLRASFPDHYRWIVGGITSVAVVGAIGWAIAQVRRSGHAASERPIALSARERYSFLIAAIALGVGYARAVSTGDIEVDLVEAFHFVEYGLVAHLFYRSLRQRADASSVMLAGCAGLAVGIADEWIQWFVPGRVGELHDILLNAVAIGCGLLFSTAVYPPQSRAWPVRHRSRVAIGAAVSGLLLALAGFVDRVHLGYQIGDGQTGVFRSRYTAEALTDAAADRPYRWRVAPPPSEGFRHEDHYLSEGQWHAQRRSLAMGTGDGWTVLHEDAILDHFYAPVLDLNGRLSAAQRAQFERNAQSHARAMYVSAAAPYPIYVFSRPAFWTVTLLLAAIVAWLVSRV